MSAIPVLRLGMTSVDRRLALSFAGVLSFVSACSDNLSGDLRAVSFGDLSNPPASRVDGYREIGAACDGVAGARAPHVRRRPYLQQLTSTSARLLWTTADETPASVTVALPDGSLVSHVDALRDGTITGAKRAPQWLASIEGLSPATTYCYEVQGPTGSWERAGFRTPPAPGAGAAVRFVAFGDSGPSDEDAAYAQMRTVPFDFLIHTGDMAYEDGAISEFEETFFEVYADTLRGFAVFPASGNHEYHTNAAQPFRDVFSLPENGGPEGIERWYSFDWGDVHFAALDTERNGPVQAAWLEADLTANRLPWTIVYGHKPPYSSGSHGSYSDFRKHYGPILEKHAAPLVLTGHDHHYERTKPQNGVVYVVSGGGGRGTRLAGRSGFTAFVESVIHFVYIEVQGDTLALHAIDGVGTEFDSLVLRR